MRFQLFNWVLICHLCHTNVPNALLSSFAGRSLMLRIAYYTETQLRRACKRPDHQMGHRENQPALLFSTKILQTAGASRFTPETSSIKSHSALLSLSYV